jgi:DNA polymerase I-like protein with 3'-5' exonuclease and polymerase domains
VLKFAPKAQAISREINPIRPFEPEPAIGNTHVLDEIAGLPHRCEHAALGDYRRITGKGLAQTAWRDYGIDMPPAEGDRVIARFFDKYKLVKRWMEASRITSTRLGYVTIGAGRIVDRCWEKTRQLSPQQCANLPVQGISADCMLRALKLTHERLCAAKIEGGLIASIHDELLIEVPIITMEEAKQILKAAMTEAFEMTFPGAPMTGGVVDVKTGPSWGELE